MSLGDGSVHADTQMANDDFLKAREVIEISKSSKLNCMSLKTEV